MSQHSRSIISNKKACFRTGNTSCLHRHHVMNGPFRNKAEKYGLWVYLNIKVHDWLHNTREGKAYDRELKELAQEKFEEIYSHEEWMKEFKKNYL